MTRQPEPPNREVRQPRPDEFVLPPREVETPDDELVEEVDEQLATDDSTPFTSENAIDPKPNAPSTGLPSDSPGG